MTKLFYSEEKQSHLIDQGVVLLLYRTNDLWITVEHLRRPYKSNGRPDRGKLAQLAQKLEREAKIHLGSSAERHLFGMLPGFLMDRMGHRSLHDNELYYGILAAFKHKYHLIGASAANHFKPTTGYQFADDLCLKSGLVLALVESDLSAGTGMEHGFKPHRRKQVTVTKLAGDREFGYEAITLDNKPASERIFELRNELSLAEDVNPVLGLHSAGDYKIIFPIDPRHDTSEPVRFNREVAKGDTFRVMLPRPPGSMLKVVEHVMEDALKASGGGVEDLALILGFACDGHFAHYDKLGVDWTKAAGWIRRKYGTVPTVVGFCAGEFGVDLYHGARANNRSLWARCWLNRYSARAATRELQRRLMDASATLLTRHSPQEVMKTALEEAVKAGAEGGQICLVDRQLGFILGEGFGYATPVSSLGHNWVAVAKRTKRRAPRTTGGDFPLELRDWSMPMASDIPQATFGPVRREDILTLITRTLRAVFVPDQRSRIFRCDPGARKFSKLQAFLAVPLVGSPNPHAPSEPRAIGTLQISFPNGRLLDRESFAHWVSYGQKIASTLEREQEIEERQFREAIERESKAILDEPVDCKSGRYAWCDRFLQKLVKLLDADYTHMRVLKDNGFHLVASAPDGRMSKLRRDTRAVTRAGERGALSRRQLLRGGRVTNTRASTKALHSGLSAIENAPLYGEQLKSETAKVSSSAILPLFHQRRLIGTWVIDSEQENFFNERRLRIVRAAADSLGTLVRTKDADYYRAFLAEYRKRLEATLGRMGQQGRADVQLQALLRLLREITQADWGGLYLWCAPREKLILWVGDNWHRPQKGLAFYDKGEGWTGKLVSSRKDVVVLKPSNSADGDVEKYREYIEPPDRCSPPNARAARIGLRLIAGRRLVGVVTLGYYHANSHRLSELDEGTMAVLRDAQHQIADSVSAVRDKAERYWERKLHETKVKVASGLIEIPRSSAGWQPVLDDLKDGFGCERVSFYEVQNNGDVHESRAPASDPTLTPFAITRYATFRDLVNSRKKDKAVLQIWDPRDERLRAWPHRRQAGALLAVPVFSSEGKSCGVLEFIVNFHLDSLLLNSDDETKRAVWDVAKFLGSTISSQEQRKLFNELQGRYDTAMRIAATGLFSASVMHRLKGPFVEIQRAVDILRRFPDRCPEPKYRQIEMQKQHADRIIEEAHNRSVPEPRPESLRSIVRNAMEVVKSAKPSGVRLQLDNEEQATVYVEAMSLTIALINLLTNALEAMGRVGVLTVTTGRSADGSSVWVRIHNSGPSLSASDLERIRQAKESEKGGQHFGLGVALTSQVVASAGGTFELRAAKQGGVEAIVSLPVWREGKGRQARRGQGAR